MVEDKYYWCVIVMVSLNGEQAFFEDVLNNVHPFEELKAWKGYYKDDLMYKDIVLLNWCAITKEEFELYKK